MKFRVSCEHPRILVTLTACLIGTLAFSGCAATASTHEETADSIESVEEGSAVPGLEETDFGNFTWTFRPGGSVPETVRVDLTDGHAADGMVTYQLGEVVHAELSGDDQIDAAVQISRFDGNAVDEQWYLWIATAEGPVQSTLPVARAARCGNVTHSVVAVDGGVEIHETRRSIADQSVPCSDHGSDERTRVVSAIEARNVGEWWPIQTAPFVAFGGLCPMTTHLDAYESDGPLYPVPGAEAGSTPVLDGAAGVFEIEPWPVYGEPFPHWALVGVVQEGEFGCAWVERE